MRFGRSSVIWHRVQWLLLPVLAIGFVEVLVRTTMDRVPYWYAAAEQVAKRQQIDAIFVGSSRVVAAIPTAAFSERVALRTGQSLRTLNVGRGYSTVIEHYLGLRNLIRASPDNLRGVTVFIEAPGGVGINAHWNGEWVNPQQYQLILDLLTFSDLLRLWRSGADDNATKFQVALRFFVRQFALINRRERIREFTFNKLLLNLLEGHGANDTSIDELAQDLQGLYARVIRSDDAALRQARALAQKYGKEFEGSVVPAVSWEDSILDDLSRLLDQVNGRLVFFVPPESEAFLRGYRSTQRRQEQLDFAEQARNRGACVIKPEFKYSDEDLPDLWHLRVEVAPKFSQIVADTWLANCRVNVSVKSSRP